MATLHFIYGKPGAGKTRRAQELEASVPAVLFSEDAYIAACSEATTTLAQYVERSRRVRQLLIAPTAIRILELGLSVVFDFAGNTVPDRAWVRSIFETAHADHALHVLDVPDDECRRRVRERNVMKPDGLYFGNVSDELFDRVLPYIVPPEDSEGFHVVRS